MEPGIKVLFLAAEAEPFVKVGGLGDVTGSLPSALQALTASSPGDLPDIDIRLVIPFHGNIQRDLFLKRGLPGLRFFFELIGFFFQTRFCLIDFW